MIKLEIKLKNKYQAKIITTKKERNMERFKIDNYGPVKLNEKVFECVRKLKNYFKMIVATSENGKALKEKDFEMSKALLQFHNNK